MKSHVNSWVQFAISGLTFLQTIPLSGIIPSAQLLAVEKNRKAYRGSNHSPRYAPAYIESMPMNWNVQYMIIAGKAFKAIATNDFIHTISGRSENN